MRSNPSVGFVAYSHPFWLTSVIYPFLSGSGLFYMLQQRGGALKRIVFLSVIATSALSGCSKSDLDRCIDSQMAAWEERDRSYQKQMEALNQREPNGETVMIGNVAVPADLLGAPPSPGTRENAEASAIIRCGRVFADG